MAKANVLLSWTSAFVGFPLFIILMLDLHRSGA